VINPLIDNCIIVNILVEFIQYGGCFDQF